MKLGKGWMIGAASCVLAALAAVSGCRSVDRLLYRQGVTYTNAVVERVVTNAVVVTNVVVEFLERATVVYETNALGVVAGSVRREPVATNLVSSVVTNYVPMIVRVAQGVVVTNLVERPGVALVAETLPKAVDGLVPGLGSLLALVLGGLYHGYRQVRNRQLTAVLVQGVETARAILETTPQGAAADVELVAWLKGHQREAGVIGAAAAAVEAHVNNAAARGVAAEIVERVQRAGGK